MKNIHSIALVRTSAVLWCSVVCAGCVTSQSYDRRTMQEREDQLIMQEENRRLTGRLEAMEIEQERIRNELSRLLGDSNRMMSAQADSLEARLSALERQIHTLEAAREKDKQEIIDKLSKTVSQLMKSSSSGGGSRRSTGKRISEYGYEHVVQAGETLSEIAQTYDVSVSVVIEANNMENPDSLRVGQKLFIPE